MAGVGRPAGINPEQAAVVPEHGSRATGHAVSVCVFDIEDQGVLVVQRFFERERAGVRHGRWQHDVSQLRCVGHERLVDADEQVVAQQTCPHLGAFRSDRRIGILDQHRVDLWLVA